MRLPIRVEAELENQIVSQKARMVDVSEGGLSFLGAKYLPPGTPVKVNFAKCSLMGEVRRCRLQEYGARTQFVTGVQVQSIAAGQEDWTALAKKSIGTA